MDSQSGGSAMLMIVPMALGLIGYIYIAACLYVMAQKTNVETPWLAFVPIINIIIPFQIAGISLIWILAMFIPLVNLAVMIWVWIKIAEARNKPAFWGVLMIVPGINLIVPLVLAMGD
jgi:hypothetical protein